MGEIKMMTCYLNLTVVAHHTDRPAFSCHTDNDRFINSSRNCVATVAGTKYVDTDRWQLRSQTGSVTH